MQLPIKAHYATVAMLALAQQFASGGLVTARAIADEHDIPPQFLVQILQQLRAAGMITSTRGSSGGFRLERAPSSITVADIVEAVCPAAHSQPIESPSLLNAVVQDVWSELSTLQDQHLSRITLSQLCEQASATTQSMFYI
jgi:Rrf2 family protein